MIGRVWSVLLSLFALFALISPQTWVIFATTLFPVDSKPFDLKIFFFPASMNAWNTRTRDLWPPLFSAPLSHRVESCRWVSSIQKRERFSCIYLSTAFFFYSTMFNTLDLLFSLRAMTWAKAPFIRDDTPYFNLCRGHYNTLLICCIDWAIRQQHFAPDLSTY